MGLVTVKLHCPDVSVVQLVADTVAPDEAAMVKLPPEARLS